MKTSFKNKAKNWIKTKPELRNIARIARTKYFGDLGWSKLGESIALRSEGIVKQSNILVATSFGGEIAMTAVESLLSAALLIRRANVHVFLCDGIAACQLCDTTRFSSTEDFVKNGLPNYVCKACSSAGMNIYRSLKLITHKMSDYLQEADYEFAKELSETHPIDHIKGLKIDSVPVGEHAFAGTCRYFAKADFSDEPQKERVLRKYLYSSLLVMRSTQKLMRKIDFSCVVLNHGIYVPQGVIADVARLEQARVVTWNTAYRKQCFIFSHNDTYHHELMNEPNENWHTIDLNDFREAEITKYIYSRSVGDADWISFNTLPRKDDENLREKLGIDSDKKIITLYTNVMWDAQLHYPTNIFNDMLEWIIETIQHFIKRKDIQLIIRIHPAELSGHLVSRQLVTEIIRNKFGSNKNNISIVGPDDPINSYNLALISDSVIIYGSKIGVELSTMGIPVIVAGEAWLRNKGIAIEPTTKENYFLELDRLPIGTKTSPENVLQAKKYAYHFFFRRMIPLRSIKPTGGVPTFTVEVSSVEELMPGYCKGLDIVCSGILNGTEFIYE